MLTEGYNLMSATSVGAASAAAGPSVLIATLHCSNSCWLNTVGEFPWRVGGEGS